LEGASLYKGVLRFYMTNLFHQSDKGEVKVGSLVSQEVLGIEKVGIKDNFFDLGGHSLLATQVANRIRNAFSIDLPLRTLFEGSTAAELGECIQAIRWQAEESKEDLRNYKKDEREEGEI